MTLYALGATTIAGYRLRTGDVTADDVAVSGALVDAERSLEETLRRRLASESRTDAFTIQADGRIYPDAWPITTADLTIYGRALLGGTPDLEEWVGWTGSTCYPHKATVTWTGGFDDDTLPITLRNAIYDLARARLTLVPSIPGATSASVGDVSVTYAEPGGGDLDAAVPGLTARIAKYANRFV